MVNIPRSAIYYKKRIDESDSVFTNLISEIWLEMPSYGHRKITKELQRDGYNINRKRVLRLMQEAKIQAIFPKPKTSIPNEENAIYPYLLKNLVINRPNQVWKTDITYIKMRHGWMYLVAIIDVYSRRIIAWRLSNTMEVGFCIDMLEEALTIAKPEILNSDQGAQYTSPKWIKILVNHGIKISMDGKGRWADNIIIERFWRTLKHENVLIHIFDTVIELKGSIKKFIDIYNDRRLHQSLGYKTPTEIYKEIYVAPSYMVGKKKESENNPQITTNASGGGLLSSPLKLAKHNNLLEINSK